MYRLFLAFIFSLQVVEIPENVASGSVVARLPVTSPSPDQNITCSFLPSQSDPSFSVRYSAGQCLVYNIGLLDYDVRSIYNLSLTVNYVNASLASGRFSILY